MTDKFLRGLGRPCGVLLAVCALASISEAGPPDDPVGNWKLSYVCPDGRSRDCVLTVSRRGQVLEATCTSDGVTHAARAVSFDRGILSVRVEGQYAGSRYDVTYKGRPSGATLRGDVRWSYLWASGSFAFQGERMIEDGVARR